LQALPAVGDPLERLAAIVSFKPFRPDLDAALPESWTGGQPPPMPLETMLRRYASSNPMGGLYDSEAMHRFAGIELGDA